MTSAERYPATSRISSSSPSCAPPLGRYRWRARVVGGDSALGARQRLCSFFRVVSTDSPEPYPQSSCTRNYRQSSGVVSTDSPHSHALRVRLSLKLHTRSTLACMQRQRQNTGTTEQKKEHARYLSCVPQASVCNAGRFLLHKLLVIHDARGRLSACMCRHACVGMHVWG